MSATSAIARDIMAHVHTFCTHHPESLFNALWPELSWGLVLRFRPTTTSTSFCKGLQAGKQHLKQLLWNLFCCVVFDTFVFIELVATKGLFHLHSR